MQFPILTLMPSYGGWAEPGAEELKWFYTEDELCRLDAFDRKNGTHADMLAIDAAGRNWRVEKMTDLGPQGRGLRKLFSWMFGDHRFQFNMVDVDAPLLFDGVKERVCTAIQARPYVWWDDEAIAGESGEPQDEQVMLAELIRKVRTTLNITELITVLDNS